MTSGQPSAPYTIPSQRDPLVGVALLGIAAVYVRALAFTPIEARQGAAQKIMYIHATRRGCGWAGAPAASAPPAMDFSSERRSSVMFMPYRITS